MSELSDIEEQLRKNHFNQKATEWIEIGSLANKFALNCTGHVALDSIIVAPNKKFVDTMNEIRDALIAQAWARQRDHIISAFVRKVNEQILKDGAM